MEIQSLLNINEWNKLNNQFNSEEVLSWDDIIEMNNDKLVDFGSHGLDHFICHNSQDPDETKMQIIKSKAIIKGKLGKCNWFSYPNGRIQDISKLAYDIVKSEFKLAFSTVRANIDKNSNKHLLPRIIPYCNLSRYRANLKISFLKFTKQKYEREIVNLVKSIS